MGQQALIFAGGEMENVKTLASYDIHEASTIYLVPQRANTPRTHTLVARTPTGTHELQVASTDRIDLVKALLHGKAGHLPWRQRLIWRGKEMANGSTLEDNNIMSGSTVHLVVSPTSSAAVPVHDFSTLTLKEVKARAKDAIPEWNGEGEPQVTSDGEADIIMVCCSHLDALMVKANAAGRQGQATRIITYNGYLERWLRRRGQM